MRESELFDAAELIDVSLGGIEINALGKILSGLGRITRGAVESATRKVSSRVVRFRSDRLVDQ